VKARFKDLVADQTQLLVLDHGFTLVGRRFIREDELIRSAWFVPGATLPGRFRFDILFDIGIAGLSSFSSKAQLWVVRCSASQLRDIDSLPAVHLELTAGADDERLREGVRLICSYVTDNFLMRHKTAEDLYRWVCSNVIEFLNDPNYDNDFRRLRLNPWNVIPRVELAAVYAAHLGRYDDAASLEAMAIDYARTHRLREAIPGIKANIAAAGRTAASDLSTDS
jgi:hypothetical protein